MRWVPWFLQSGWGRENESTMDGPSCADLGPDFSGAVMHGLQWPVWIHYLGKGCVAQADFSDTSQGW